MTDKMIKGLGSEKLLVKNQQKKIERLLEANKLMTSDLDNEEFRIEKTLQGKPVLQEIQHKEIIVVNQLSEIRREFEATEKEEEALDKELEALDFDLSHCKCQMHLLNSQNEKLKAKYLRNEKQSSHLDSRIRKIQESVKKTINQNDKSDSKGSSKNADDEKKDQLIQLRRKCRSYHGTPEKLTWETENQEAVAKAKYDLEQELVKLKQEYIKLSQLDTYLKKKATSSDQRGLQEEINYAGS